MLVLSRHKDETIVLPELGISIVVVDIRSDKVRIGISAPKEVIVHRLEVQEAIEREQKTANQAEANS